MNPPLVTVHGTWGLEHHTFFLPDSLFQRRAAARGFLIQDDPFLWRGDLAIRDQTAWQIGAHAFIWYCKAKGLEEPAVITHSHGVQVVALAAAWGQKISSLVDVEGPVRHDMVDTYLLATSNIGRWLHTWNTGDRAILEGEIGAGGSPSTLMPYADNLEVHPLYEHSGLFTDLEAWDALGLWDRLRTGSP